jgi:hypothetical protein
MNLSYSPSLTRARQRRRLIAPVAAVGLIVSGAAWVATPAVAAPSEASPAAVAALTDYDTEIVSQFDSANSVEHIRHLAVDIGPRLNGTPQERRGAEYIGSILESYGFKVQLQSWGPVSTKRVAAVTSPDATLPGGPNWQMSASTSGKFTGDDAPVVGSVIDVGTGLTAADFPDDTAGKVVVANYTSNATSRNTVVANAVARGATAVILVQPTGTSAPPSFTLTTAQPTVPVLGGGAAHGTWIRQLLTQGPLTLRIATNEYVNPMGTNVIGTRHAVGDPDGTTAPIVMIGAHIDSVLGAPGAHDDASGNGVSLEFARVLSQYPLDKELRVGGFGGEESGLLGARAYVATLNQAERARFVGEWQMDMVGTPYGPAGLWALTPNGASNLVVQSAYDAVDRLGRDDVVLRNCRLGQSDHQAFYDVGIPSSLFIWLDYRPPASGDCTRNSGSYVTEPEYHRPTDTMDNISPERLQITLDVVGGAAAHHALNAVNIDATGADGGALANSKVRADCGDGWRPLGTTDARGKLTAVFPHATCTLEAASGAALVQRTVDVHGDQDLALTVALPVCTTTITGTRSGQLNVTSGVTCLVGAKTSGPIKVSRGASLVALGSTLGGPLSATDADEVTVCGGAISGPVTVTSAKRARLGSLDGGCAGVTVDGPVTVSNSGELLVLAGNKISGPVSLVGNHGTVPALVGGNTVSGPMSCSGNEPGLDNEGTTNTASGPQRDQCALL